MDKLLPTVDTPLPGSSMMDMLLWTCFCPLWTARISYNGYAPMDMPLPAMAMDMPLPGPLMMVMLLQVMDMDMPLPGLLMVDMLLPAMNMPCPRWIRPLPEPSMTDTLSWI